MLSVIEIRHNQTLRGGVGGSKVNGASWFHSTYLPTYYFPVCPVPDPPDARLNQSVYPTSGKTDTKLWYAKTQCRGGGGGGGQCTSMLMTKSE